MGGHVRVVKTCECLGLEIDGVLPDLKLHARSALGLMRCGRVRGGLLEVTCEPSVRLGYRAGTFLHLASWHTGT